jgi:diguanylate cyclase (GGDEF)-like protein
MEEIKALIIENNKESAQELEDIMQRLGCKISVVDNARDGLSLLNKGYFSVVLTELNMPQMNGTEITQEVMQVSPETTVLTITPTASIDAAIETMDKGAYGYVICPFHPTEIRIMVERAIERSYLLKRAHERIYYKRLSIKDPLTGIYNKRHLINQLQERIVMLRERLDGKFSLLMIDVDGFKKYNDTKGHPAGDDLLKKLSQLLCDGTRGKDQVFRYGGEEFTVILDRADKKVAASVGNRLRATVEAKLPITISLGLSTFPEDAKDADTLIGRADKALYLAKNSGKNRLCIA